MGGNSSKVCHILFGKRQVLIFFKNLFEEASTAFLPFLFKDMTFLISLEFVFLFPHESFILSFTYSHDPKSLLGALIRQPIKSMFLKDFLFLKEQIAVLLFLLSI